MHDRVNEMRIKPVEGLRKEAESRQTACETSITIHKGSIEGRGNMFVTFRRTAAPPGACLHPNNSGTDMRKLSS